jgi:pyruvate,water dikinase
MNQASNRLFVSPLSLGVEYRVLNGYVYISGNSVADEKTLARRTELFTSRGGHYLRHWDELYERWVEKVEGTIRELQQLAVPELPELEDEAVVTEAHGIGSGHRLLVAYDRLIEGLDRVMQYHFELNGLGYGAYLVFYELCRQAFPDITDQTIARMVSGIDLLVLRPDEELKRLAQLALELGVAEAIEGADDEASLRTALAGTEPGARWLADFDETKDPWLYLSNGNGLYHPNAHGLTTRAGRSPPSARMSGGSRPVRTSPVRTPQCARSASGSRPATAR